MVRFLPFVLAMFLGSTPAPAQPADAYVLDFNGSCTGSYLEIQGEKYVVTAAHCLRDYPLYQVRDNHGHTSWVAPVHVNQTKDIAFLRGPMGSFEARPTRLGKVAVGDQVQYIGHPYPAFYLDLQGRVALLDNYSRVVVHGFAYFRSSGSAVFDPQGNLLGVVSGIVTDDKGGRHLEDLWVFHLLSKEDLP